MSKLDDAILGLIAVTAIAGMSLMGFQYAMESKAKPWILILDPASGCVYLQSPDKVMNPVVDTSGNHWGCKK